jgi:DNA-binding NarL/FixJ family response regulator
MVIAPGMAARAGLRALLSGEPSIQVISEAASLAELEPEQAAADVVIWAPAQYLDRVAGQVDLGQMKLGEESALLLIHNDPKVIKQLAQLPVRAWGMLDPEATQAELTTSIQALYEGLVVVNPAWVLQALNNRETGNGATQDLVQPLTEREIEILQLLAYGLTNKQIAARLKISAHTVKFHVSSIFSKLGITNRVEAVNLGLKRGLILL